VAVAWSLPTPDGLATVGWWIVTMLASLTALLLTERLSRRVLSLSMLLRLSLVN
jgi:hypothetical protein